MGGGWQLTLGCMQWAVSGKIEYTLEGISKRLKICLPGIPYLNNYLSPQFPTPASHRF